MGVARDTTTSGTANNYFFEHPKTSIRYNDTNASLVTTSKAFSDFQMTLDMKTVKQLRQNSPPAHGRQHGFFGIIQIGSITMVLF